MASDMPNNATRPVSGGVTLQDCADEPIRIPGSVQPHGFLLGLDEDYRKVVVASESAADYLGTPLKLILNAPVATLFQRELVVSIEHQRCAMQPDGMVSYLGSFRDPRRDVFAGGALRGRPACP